MSDRSGLFGLHKARFCLIQTASRSVKTVCGTGKQRLPVPSGSFVAAKIVQARANCACPWHPLSGANESMPGYSESADNEKLSTFLAQCGQDVAEIAIHQRVALGGRTGPRPTATSYRSFARPSSCPIDRLPSLDRRACGRECCGHYQPCEISLPAVESIPLFSILAQLRPFCP
jgi:hypothetical protein